VLILGVGNILLRDEGVGVRVVEAMQCADLPSEVEVFDGGTAGIDLLDVLADRRKVVVVDAMDGDVEPGTVMRLTPEDLLPTSGQGVSLHEMSLMETLAVAQRMGIAPQEVVILGIKPQELGWGLELSPVVAGVVPRVVELAWAETTRKNAETRKRQDIG
jgi:hydrogenase maturation protease